MKFYNYFSDQSELQSYIEGNFSGKGIYFDPAEFKKKETLRSNLKLSSKNGNLEFHLKLKNKDSLKFKTEISQISGIKEDFCAFLSNEKFQIQIQAMTKDKMHIHISESKIIYISGILKRRNFFWMTILISNLSI